MKNIVDLAPFKSYITQKRKKKKKENKQKNKKNLKRVM